LPWGTRIWRLMLPKSGQIFSAGSERFQRMLTMNQAGGSTESGAGSLLEVTRRSRWSRYVVALGGLGLSTALLWELHPYLNLTLTNLVMIYLLLVVIAASGLGRGPSILVSLLSVATLAYFFVPPYFSFRVKNTEYAIDLAVMFTVSILIGELTGRIRYQAQMARMQERQTAVLYEMSRTLPAIHSLQDLLQTVLAQVATIFGSRVSVLMPDPGGELHLRAGEPFDDEYGREKLVGRWVFRHGHRAGPGTQTLPQAKGFYLPLRASHAVIGVLRLESQDPRRVNDPASRQFLEALGSQIALAIERDSLFRQTQEGRVEIEAERMRCALLSSVSHDLRTPLTVIAGSASSLVEGENHLNDETKRELAQAIYEEAYRLERLVNNLLEMSRLQAGEIKLLKEWEALEEVVGAALAQLEAQLKDNPVITDIPPDLPLVRMDQMLMERVLVNLLENAVKYTPEGAPIHISGRVEGDRLKVEVADHGPGLPLGEEERVFGKFYQVARGRSRGAGLGLTICRSIVEAHGGRIWAANRPAGGAVFTFTLPLGEPAPEVTTPDHQGEP
jgi:two-component system, OmpR family, sensor histidine kinase KdpD